MGSLRQSVSTRVMGSYWRSIFQGFSFVIPKTLLEQLCETDLSGSCADDIPLRQSASSFTSSNRSAASIDGDLVSFMVPPDPRWTQNIPGVLQAEQLLLDNNNNNNCNDINNNIITSNAGVIENNYDETSKSSKKSSFPLKKLGMKLFHRFSWTSSSSSHTNTTNTNASESMPNELVKENITKNNMMIYSDETKQTGCNDQQRRPYPSAFDRIPSNDVVKNISQRNVNLLADSRNHNHNHVSMLMSLEDIQKEEEEEGTKDRIVFRPLPPISRVEEIRRRKHDSLQNTDLNSNVHKEDKNESESVVTGSKLSAVSDEVSLEWHMQKTALHNQKYPCGAGLRGLIEEESLLQQQYTDDPNYNLHIPSASLKDINGSAYFPFLDCDVCNTDPELLNLS